MNKNTMAHRLSLFSQALPRALRLTRLKSSGFQQIFGKF
jgi:hypothetical protein